jgi:DNA-binding CsgD family transcriptional regulator
LRDPIGVLEAAYDLDAADEEGWLTRTARAVRTNVPSAQAAIAFTYSVRADGYIVPQALTEIDTPTSFAQTLLQVQLSPVEAAMLSQYYLTSGLGFGSALAAKLPDAGPDFFAKAILGHGFGDLLTVNAADPSRSGCMIGVALRSAGRAGSSERKQWGCLAAHMAAGLRLYRRLRPAGARTSAGGDAVLSPSGKVDHAEGEATSKSARAALRSAVLAVERARGPLRRSQPEEAIEVWRGLIFGRWSLIDRFERDGRRYLVAHRNDPDVPDPRALTRRERQVVGFAALGQPNKLIAYELGLSPSTVGVLMARAARKLGARSRTELLKSYLERQSQ